MLLVGAGGAGCSNKKEIRAAKASVYDADFAIVYSEVVAAVRELYPNLDEDPRTGTIRTAWHQVQFSTGAEDPRTMQQRDPALASNDPTNPGGGGTGTFTTPATATYKRLFIRFDVTVTGGRPWRIRIVGKASEWDPGNAQPTELRGAATPHWLGGRKDGLHVAIYRRLKSYAKQIELPPEEKDEKEEVVAVDPAQFGDIPPAAGQTAAALVQAIEVRDMKALRAALADDVVWSLGAAGDAETAIAMWQADPATLDALAEALTLGCRKDGDARVACPPAATEEPGYLGWRATLELAGDAWKLTSFVKGD